MLDGKWVTYRRKQWNFLFIDFFMFQPTNFDIWDWRRILLIVYLLSVALSLLWGLNLTGSAPEIKTFEKALAKFLKGSALYLRKRFF